MPVAKQDRREFTTKDTKDTKNGIRLKRTSAIGRVQKRKEIVVSLNEAHSPKLNVADKLLTLQENRLYAAPGARHVLWLASDVALVL